MTDLPIETDCCTVARQIAAGEIVLIDCRERDEFERVRIEGALLFPMSEIAQRVHELEPYRDRHLVVHCHHGGRSLRVTNWLRDGGFEKVQNMAGGIDQWALEIEPGMLRY